MISRSEIESVSSQLGVNVSDVQRDYVFGWILSSLFSTSHLGSSLVLKGGNGFRKAYFAGARYSGDLDFSTAQAIDPIELGRELNAICDVINKRAGIQFDIERIRVDEKTSADAKTISKARIYFKDFFGKDSEVTLAIRMDVSQFDRLYLPVQQRPLIHLYSDAEFCATDIRCVKLEELLATKMRCLLQRKHIADLFDLVYATMITGDITVNRSELLSTFFKITIFQRSPGVVKGLFLDLPLEALSTFWEKYISCPIGSRLTFSAARDGFISLIESLISAQPIHENSHTFFPSSLRNPIIEAGEKLTLLRLRYDGAERLVEPYSLAFKTRQDGVAREYLYAYDTTGGRSSGPGIKTFIPAKVVSIENTDVSFEPRYEVELRKAGGSEIAGRFKGHPKVPKFLSPMQIKYTIECPYCRRRFRRKQLNLRLSAHKDRYGNPCFGRVGFRVMN